MHFVSYPHLWSPYLRPPLCQPCRQLCGICFPLGPRQERHCASVSHTLSMITHH
ncbi:hypothetical protein LY76DRAFT_688630 [Colletotrichum caudatum]|nr:hypothetical protein LY76DRAFT_688630 [Colletotrichum caudatum]